MDRAELRQHVELCIQQWLDAHGIVAAPPDSTSTIVTSLSDDSFTNANLPHKQKLFEMVRSAGEIVACQHQVEEVDKALSLLRASNINGIVLRYKGKESTSEALIEPSLGDDKVSALIEFRASLITKMCEYVGAITVEQITLDAYYSGLFSNYFERLSRITQSDAALARRMAGSTSSISINEGCSSTLNNHSALMLEPTACPPDSLASVKDTIVAILQYVDYPDNKRANAFVEAMNNVERYVDSNTSRESSVDSTADSIPNIFRPRSTFSHEGRCNTCLEDNECWVTPTCKHLFCMECMTLLFKKAITDLTLLPVRCCSDKIPLAIAESILEPHDNEVLLSRTEEATATKIAYCSSKSCLAFINLSNLPETQQTINCEKCGTLACCSCGKAAHTGLSCEFFRVMNETENDRLFAQVATTERYQRCRCGSWVELETGCHHMTCSRCRYEFCYLCGALWKTCRCPQWEENRLLARGNQIVANLNRGRLIAPAVRQAEVNRVVNYIRENHDCRHTWVKNDVSHRRCTNCGFHLYVYGYRCMRQHCDALVCHTCRFHRLGRS